LPSPTSPCQPPSGGEPTPPAPGLYIHIPFCRTKCAYCDFLSGPHPAIDRRRYLQALERELLSRLPEFPPFRTLFIGGGSPSSLEQEDWEFLFDLIRRHLDTSQLVEATIEMNPAQVTAEKVAALPDFIRRVSLGVQTFQPRLRKILNRQPIDTDPVERAVELLAGRVRLNLDLVHSIPTETMEEFEEDLKKAIALHPGHLSVYALIEEKGTPLATRIERGEIPSSDENVSADCLLKTRAVLTGAGYTHYEISNFSKPGEACLHNLACWHGKEYLGIGLGAASHHDGERTSNETNLLRYQERIERDGTAIETREHLSPRDRAGELAMLGLRMRAGINQATFQAATGFNPLVIFQEAIQKHKSLNLLEETSTHLRLTEKGLDLANLVMRDFL